MLYIKLGNLQNILALHVFVNYIVFKSIKLKISGGSLAIRRITC